MRKAELVAALEAALGVGPQPQQQERHGGER